MQAVCGAGLRLRVHEQPNDDKLAASRHFGASLLPDQLLGLCCSTPHRRIGLVLDIQSSDKVVSQCKRCVAQGLVCVLCQLRLVTLAPPLLPNHLLGLCCSSPHRYIGLVLDIQCSNVVKSECRWCQAQGLACVCTSCSTMRSSCIWSFRRLLFSNDQLSSVFVARPPTVTFDGPSISRVPLWSSVSADGVWGRAWSACAQTIQHCLAICM